MEVSVIGHDDRRDVHQSIRAIDLVRVVSPKDLSGPGYMSSIEVLTSCFQKTSSPVQWALTRYETTVPPKRLTRPGHNTVLM